jgi:hypothetical protein
MSHDESSPPRPDPDRVLPSPSPLAPPVLDESFVAPPPLPLPPLPAPVLTEPVAATPVPLLPAPVVDTDELEIVPVVKPTVLQRLPKVAVPAVLVPKVALPLVELGVLAALAVVLVAGFLGITWLAAVLALVLIAGAGLWVLARQPVLVFCAMALLLGAAPGVQTPVLGVSVAFVLSAAIWVALAVMPEVQHRVGWGAGLSAVLIGTAVFTLLGNPITGAAVSDFVRWSVTAAAIYPLSVLPGAYLARVGRWFVHGCTAAAAFGIVLVAIDRDGSKLNKLTIFGYDPNGGNGRFVFGANGNFARLTSTYVDPNLGGFLMAVGLILGLALLRGRLRVISAGILVVAIALTLSRADIGSVAVGGVVLVLFSHVSGRIRGRLLTLGLGAGFAMLAIPAIRSRLTNSFGANDRGSSARWDAFRIFPDQMAGHWILGRGFGAPELINANAAAATNYVANAPLLSVYRGGLVVGLAFTALMLTAGLHAWRLLRRTGFEPAVVGAGYVGIMLVALQLDFPVVTLSPATLAFSLLLAFLGRPDAFAVADQADEPDAVEEEPVGGDRELEVRYG